MRTLGYTLVFAAIVASLPLSWWLAGRSRREPQDRLNKDNRTAIDRLSAGTSFGMVAGGGGGHSAGGGDCGGGADA